MQNKLKNYGAFEEGNTLSFETFQKYLNEIDNKVSVKDHIIPRMKDLIIDSILSCIDTINPNNIKYSFELFGYDFMIDEDFRVWLIEVNDNPYLGIANKYIE